MEQRISIITLGVDDILRSKDFYERGLGIKPLEFSNQYITFYRMGSVWLALYSREALAKDAAVASEGSGFHGFTIAHNVRTKDEVDIMIDEARSAGANIIKEPQIAEWGGYSGYFSDPDGYLWEVAYNPEFWVE
jgi:catechol 2,3-dioxygenase-like lactoylglutathione lyase family enzyme